MIRCNAIKIIKKREKKSKTAAAKRQTARLNSRGKKLLINEWELHLRLGQTGCLRCVIQSTTTRSLRARRVIYTRSSGSDVPHQPTNPPNHQPTETTENTHPPTAFGVHNYTSLFVDLIVVGTLFAHLVSAFDLFTK